MFPENSSVFVTAPTLPDTPSVLVEAVLSAQQQANVLAQMAEEAPRLRFQLFPDVAGVSFREQAERRAELELAERVAGHQYRPPVEAERYVDNASTEPMDVAWGPGWLGRTARKIRYLFLFGVP